MGKNAWMKNLQVQAYEIACQRTEVQREFFLMAIVLGANESLHISEKRMPALLHGVIKHLNEISKTLVDDVGDSHRRKNALGDPEFLVTRRNLAAKIKKIVGTETWLELREQLPMLKPYWEWEEEK